MTNRVDFDSGLLVSSNFIRAVRESGYLNIATALAELIDNSVQASATKVTVTIGRESRGAFPEIVVEDNGIGMSNSELQNCLRFGGSTRFDSRHSLGRFGMGLPAASLSQARRVEVTSWRGGGRERTVTLDVDSIVAGEQPSFTAEVGERNFSTSGCRVRWTNCDRIEYQRLAWLERLLHQELGRMFRRFLDNGLTIAINEAPVKSIDPTLLTTAIGGASAKLAFDEIAYEFETGGGETSIIRVRFVIFPVHDWHDLDNATKRRLRIVGGGGVSILRAGREIAKGWHFMGSKRKENYDDWWRCEIEFDPCLDEHFGIAINKQGIRASALLRETLEPEIESIARILNSRVRQAFEDVKFRAASEVSCQIANACDPDLPVIDSTGQHEALRYRLDSAVMPMDSMFSAALVHRTIDLTFNADHPAFVALLRPLRELEGPAGVELRTSLELFLLSFARSAIQLEKAGHSLDTLLRTWSATYGRMLQKS